MKLTYITLQNLNQNPTKMSSQNQGRQSPEPERESGAQKGSASSGHGVNDDSKNEQESKKQLDVSDFETMSGWLCRLLMNEFRVFHLTPRVLLIRRWTRSSARR
jgi:hypothetical protein